MGAVHFTVTSSEHDYSPGSDQHNWVLADLSSVDRTLTPWIVFTSHRPLYTAACSNLPLQHACQIESPVFQALQVAWEDVLIQHNVTLAATAHIHYYERTCAVAHGVCANSSSSPASPRAAAAAQVKPQPAPMGAPVYIVVGPAGAMLLLMALAVFRVTHRVRAGLVEFLQTRVFSPSKSQNLPPPPRSPTTPAPSGAPITPLPVPPHPSWTASLIDVFGFSVVRANASHFNFQFIADGSGDVLDEFLFTQQP